MNVNFMGMGMLICATSCMFSSSPVFILAGMVDIDRARLVRVSVVGSLYVQDSVQE